MTNSPVPILTRAFSEIMGFPVEIETLTSEVNMGYDNTPRFHCSVSVAPALPFSDPPVPYGNDCCGYSCESCGYDPDAFAFGIPGIDRILFNDPATIVFWEDGTKTVVKCMAGEKFERYAGFAAAVMKKMFGSTSAAKSFMNGMDDTVPVKREPEKTPPPEKPRQDVKDQKLSEHDLTMMAVLGLAAAKVLAKKAKEDQDESSAG